MVCKRAGLPAVDSGCSGFVAVVVVVVVAAAVVVVVIIVFCCVYWAFKMADGVRKKM